MDLFWGNVECLTGAHASLRHRLAPLNSQDDFARKDVNRFILLVVILQRQHLSRLDMENLPHIAVGLRPDDLVSPRLFYSIRQIGHASLSFSDEGVVTHAVTHTPQPTHPSGFSTGRPRSSSARARSPIGQARAHTPHSAP